MITLEAPPCRHHVRLEINDIDDFGHVYSSCMSKVSINASARNACHRLSASTSLDESSDASRCQIQEASDTSTSWRRLDESADLLSLVGTASIKAPLP